MTGRHEWGGSYLAALVGTEKGIPVPIGYICR